jgi:hypothetical protein
MQVAQIAHKTTSGIASKEPLVIGGRGRSGSHLFDGLIDDVRISTIPLPQERLLLTREGVFEHTVGYWKFEQDPGVYKDLSQRGGDIVAERAVKPTVDPAFAALADLCHVLLNSNEFLYLD